MLGADVATLQTLWADELIVNSTANLIAGKQILLEMIKSGRLKLRAYERRPVRIQSWGDLVVHHGQRGFRADRKRPRVADIRQLHEHMVEARR